MPIYKSINPDGQYEGSLRNGDLSVACPLVVGIKLGFDTTPGVKSHLKRNVKANLLTDCLVTFLSNSLRQYFEVVDDRMQQTLFRPLIKAFIYMAGVPGEIKSDNQKECMDCWETGRPVFNLKYLEIATHYWFRPPRTSE